MHPSLGIALAIAADRLPVFPCARTKRPAIAKARGGNGFLDAVTDPAAVEALFLRAPTAPLVGVPTGEASGRDVLDIDYRNGGEAWEIANAHRLPNTLIHGTQNGGRHYVFRHAPGVRNSASKKLLAPGIDVRGSGGYVVVPPSPGYSVINDAEVAEWPDWLLALVLARDAAEERPAPPVSSSSSSPDRATLRATRYCEAMLRTVSAAADGAKHFTLRNTGLLVGGYLHLTGWTVPGAVARLMGALPSTVQDWQGAQATATWAVQEGAKRPLELPDRELPPATHPPSQRPRGTNGAHHPEAKPADSADRTRPPGSPPQAPPHEDPRRPTIAVIAGLRHVAVDQGMAAMARAQVPFYTRDRQMVRVALSKAKTSDGTVVAIPSLVAVTNPVLGRALGTSAEWERYDKEGAAHRIDPPKDVVEQVSALSGHWPFQPVSGVIGTPTMRPDGTILRQPGYDEATGLVLVAPPPMPEIPDRPSRLDALSALTRLNGLLREFPFADDPSRSCAMSMLLTPVLRGALGSAAPMHVVAAPQPGSGKSYLQDVASVLATGERCAVTNIAPDPAETEKRLIGAALAGFPIIAIDNCNGVLSGDFLAQVTERPLLQLRPLGTSDVVRTANVFTVFANGNNIQVAADLVRRVVMCTLDANMEDPEAREFDGDPVAEILADRGRYLADALTVVKAYHAAGCPDRLPRIASFERWSDLIRSALVWLGWADPAASADAVKADDPTRNARRAIVTGWAETLQVGTGYTASEVIAAAEEFDNVSGKYVHAEFREALLEVAKARNGERIDGKRLGWWLHATAKVVTGKYKLLADRSNPERTRWRIQEVP
jgi:putative DNA primase/helicase